MDDNSRGKRSSYRSISPPAKRIKQPVEMPRRRTGTKPSTPWTRTLLDPSLSAIRILELRHGAADEPIRVKLHVVSLNDRPDYEVLSYVWGNETVTNRISVDGTSIPVTVNLFDFLHSLRLPDKNRLLWADAVCIDQNSAQEKSQQISLMRQIYRQANAAHVWFGPFSPDTYWQELGDDTKYTALPRMTPEKWKEYERDSSTTLTYLQEQEGSKFLSQRELEDFAAQCQLDIFSHTLAMLDDMAKGDHLYTYPVVARLSHGKSSGRYIIHRRWLAIMDCVRWLVTRPWWSRVWTLQEAALPRADPIVHAPPYSFKLSRLLKGVVSMCDHNNAMCCKWYGSVITTSNRDDGDFGAAFTQCRHIEAQRGALAEAAHDGEGVPLTLVTIATQERTATEVRDHWFGIFGFLSQSWQALSKRFSTPETAAGLFSQYSNLLYLESADLTLLDKARRCKTSAIDGLPSWAIDLSSPRRLNEEDNRWEKYSASGTTSYTCTIEWLELRSPSLQVKAIYVSSVQTCAEQRLPLTQTPEDLRKLASTWLTLYRAIAHPFDDDAFWRACFKDKNVQTDWQSIRKGPLHAQRLAEIKDWWKAWNETRDHRDLSLDRKAGGNRRGIFHYRELQRNTEKAGFFVTSQGLPGMGPYDMQPGDEIYALSGCKSLVVLRFLREKDVQRPTVVGLCFVDRWMYGRALQRGAVWKTMELY